MGGSPTTAGTMFRPSDPALPVLPLPDLTPEEQRERAVARLRQAVRNAVTDGLPPSQVVALVSGVLRGAPK